MYKTPRFLLNLMDGKFIKFMLICLIIYIYKNYGLNSGIMMSLIVICLLFNSYNGGFEGYDNMEEIKEVEEEEIVDSISNITDLNRKIKENSEKAKTEAKRETKEKFVPKIN